MDLDDVRALKERVVLTLLKPILEAPLAARSLGVAAMDLAAKVGTPRAIGLGIALGNGNNDLRLAVRIQNRAVEAMGDLIRTITDLANGEVDVRYVGRVFKQLPVPALMTRLRPPVIGASVGHVQVTAGTIGAFPVHAPTGRRVLLSNNHVLANENRGAIGDPILQMGVHDGGETPGDVIGALLDSVPLDFVGANEVDAAIASLDAPILARIDRPNGILGWGALTGLRLVPLGPGDTVLKLGRTTGLTRGRVSAIEVESVVIEYDSGNATFNDQIEIEGMDSEPFSQGGDSGSIVYDEQGRACGLICAGSDQGGANAKGVTYANALGRVFQALDLSLD